LVEPPGTTPRSGRRPSAGTSADSMPLTTSLTVAVAAERDDEVEAVLGGAARELGGVAAVGGLADLGVELAGQGVGQHVARAGGRACGLGVHDQERAHGAQVTGSYYDCGMRPARGAGGRIIHGGVVGYTPFKDTSAHFGRGSIRLLRSGRSRPGDSAVAAEVRQRRCYPPGMPSNPTPQALPETAGAGSEVPRPLLGAAAIVAVESLVALGYALWLVVEAFVGRLGSGGRRSRWRSRS